MNRVFPIACLFLAGCLEPALPNTPDMSSNNTVDGGGDQPACEGEACEDSVGDGIDSNQDGSDGNTALTVFVSSAKGQDTNTGFLPSDPVKTLEHAVEIAGSRTTILLARGEYVAPDDWTVDHPKFNIWGGYDEDFQSVPRADETKVLTTSTGPALTIKNGNLINLGMVEFHPSPAGGKHAITLRIENSAVKFSRVRVIRGKGKPGSNGTDGGQKITGEVGQSGANGGMGGKVTCRGIPIAGGDGGTGGNCESGMPSRPGGKGTDGLGVLFGSGGTAGGSQCDSQDVSHGGDGDSRTQATAGQSGQKTPITGRVVAGQWTNREWAVSGSQGVNGSGGAGGGGGGGARGTTADVAGGQGGGGGSGGCGGEPGQGGEHGGDAIGILALGSSTLVGPVSVLDGRGGSGGDGGDGGSFGRGGFGALGQNLGAGIGGAGGDGGAGGQGGAGAGGNGGSIYGVAFEVGVLTKALEVKDDGGEPGEAGVGGDTSDAAMPEDGTAGRRADTIEFDGP